MKIDFGFWSETIVEAAKLGTVVGVSTFFLTLPIYWIVFKYLIPVDHYRDCGSPRNLECACASTGNVHRIELHLVPGRIDDVRDGNRTVAHVRDAQEYANLCSALVRHPDVVAELHFWTAEQSSRQESGNGHDECRKAADDRCNNRRIGEN